MEITSLGYFIIPLGLILALFKNKHLLFLALFFAPFGAASILNIEEITFGLQPSYYFALLFIIKEFVIFLAKMKIAKPNFWLLFFVLFSIASMVLPIVFSGKIEVWYVEEGFYLLKPAVHNFTQLIYLLFCFLFYLFVKNFFHRVADKEKFIKGMIAVQIFSLVFVSLWGLYQFTADYLSFSFPDIFSQRIGISISHVHLGGFLKINSTFPEPSMLAFYLVPMLGFVFTLPNVYLKFNRILLMTLVFFAGLLTTSTSFLLGMVVFTLLVFGRFFFSFFRLESVRLSQKRILPLIVGVLILLVLVIMFFGRIEEMVSLVWQSTMAKFQLQEFSGIERMDRFLMGMRILKESNFLGVGFGTVRTTDLFSTLLANVGIAGFLIFLCYLLSVYLGLKKAARRGSVLSRAYLYYFLILFLIAFASVSEIYFLFIWFNLAIAETLKPKA